MRTNDRVANIVGAQAVRQITAAIRGMVTPPLPSLTPLVQEAWVVPVLLADWAYDLCTLVSRFWLDFLRCTNILVLPINLRQSWAAGVCCCATMAPEPPRISCQ